MILTNSGVLKLMQRIKSFITSQLNTKAASVHTHNASEITDLPNANGYTKSESDSLFIPKLGGVISSENIGRDVNNSRLNIWGGSNMTSGGRIILYGSDYTTASDKGRITLQAFNGSENSLLYIYPNGTFEFNNNGTYKTVAFQEDTVPRSGGQVFTGSSYTRTVDDGSLCFCGGSDTTKGATLYLYGKDRGSQSGEVTLIARKSDETGVLFKLYPNGKMTWDNGLTFTSDTIAKTDDTWYTVIRGGTTHTSAYIMCYGISSSTRAGWIRLCPTSNREMNLKPDGTWTWDGTAVQITSDQRLKQQIAEIDDKLLDAWEDVTLCQFKYNDAVEQKGDNARLHTGYVVQQIDEACQKHNIDISEYGLYCHEESPQETEEVEVNQDDGSIKKETKVIREASEHYSLRYTEVYAVECAYLRREINKLKEELKQLKAK